MLLITDLIYFCRFLCKVFFYSLSPNKERDDAEKILMLLMFMSIYILSVIFNIYIFKASL